MSKYVIEIPYQAKQAAFNRTYKEWLEENRDLIEKDLRNDMLDKNATLTMYLTKEEEIGEMALYEVELPCKVKRIGKCNDLKDYPLGNTDGIKGMNLKINN